MHAFSLDLLCSLSPSITQRNTSVQLNRIMCLCEKYIYLKFQILNHKALLRIAKSLILFSNLQKKYERRGPRALYTIQGLQCQQLLGHVYFSTQFLPLTMQVFQGEYQRTYLHDQIRLYQIVKPTKIHIYIYIYMYYFNKIA